MGFAALSKFFPWFWTYSSRLCAIHSVHSFRRSS